jgi:transposase
MLDAQLDSLNDAVTRVAQEYPGVPLLMSQPGVGAVTALAFVLTLGDVHRFPRGKQVASYLGLVPREHSSGGKQRMGGISKQGNRLLRFLLVEAANKYLHRCHQKHFTVAKVATARKRLAEEHLLTVADLIELDIFPITVSAVENRRIRRRLFLASIAVRFDPSRGP